MRVRLLTDLGTDEIVLAMIKLMQISSAASKSLRRIISLVGFAVLSLGHAEWALATAHGLTCTKQGGLGKNVKREPKEVFLSVSGAVWIYIKESNGQTTTISAEGTSKENRDGNNFTSATLVKESKEVIVFIETNQANEKSNTLPQVYFVLLPERGLIYKCL